MKLKRFVLRHWKLVAILAAAIFFAIAMMIGAGQSVWFDEDYSIILAKSSWRDLLVLTGGDAHPPLYYLLLKLWGGVGGFDDLWLRLFSGLCMAGAVFLSLLLAGKYFGRRAVLVAMPILMLSPFLLRYGFEIRMYALAALVAVGSTYALIAAVKKSSRKNWLIYAILVAAGMWTLNYMVFVFLAQMVWLILKMPRKTPAKIVREPWFRAYVLAIILYLPWLPFAIYQLAHSVSPGITTVLGPVEIVKTLSFWLLYTPEFRLGNYLGPLVITVVVAIVYVVIKAWKRARPEVRENLKLLLIICVVPFAAMAILGLFDPSGWYLERYTAHFAFAFYLLVGVSFGIILIKGKHRIRFAILYVLTIATLVVGVVNLAQTGNYNFQRMRTNAAEEIAKSVGGCQTKSPIVVDDLQTYVEISHYLPDCTNLYFYWPEKLTGAYRILENSPARLEKQKIDAKNLIVIHEQDASIFTPPKNYKLVAKNSRFQLIVIETFAK